MDLPKRAFVRPILETPEARFQVQRQRQHAECCAGDIMLPRAGLMQVARRSWPRVAAPLAAPKLGRDHGRPFGRRR